MVFEILHEALGRLQPSGVSGFEGFLRDALAELTGHGFRLMKAGPQGGVDVIGDTVGSGVVIGLEAKRYSSNTYLSQDALKAKIFDATARFPAMDLWLLATTREMSGGDIKELEEIAASQGIDAFVLDWGEPTSARLPALAALCGESPSAVLKHLGKSAKLQADLKKVRDHSEFVAVAGRLRERLRSPLVGYDATRRRVHSWIQEQMRSRGEARVAFDSYANLQQPGINRLERDKLDSQFTSWWDRHAAEPLAVLGEEGVGKTWAVLAWWLGRSSSIETFPLTLVIPAREVNERDGLELIATALEKITEIRTTEFWRRRVTRWITEETKTPRLFIVIDGLNQNWQFPDWSDLTLSLSAGRWRGQTAIAMTCRPDHWTKRLKELADLELRPRTLSVGRFDGDELKKLLELYGLSTEDFAPGMISLLQVPRLCHMAITRREELRDSGDVTAERLIYEDWRHRHHSATKALSHEEFKHLVAGIGTEINQELKEKGLARAELLARVDAGSGRPPGDFEAILSELINGRWLEPAEDPNHYKVNPESMPHALGLALVDKIRGSGSVEEALDRVTERLEPMQALDSGVRILRSATTFALLDSKVSEVSKQGLLLFWLSQQNFSEDDFEAFWRLIGSAPETTLEVVETIWFKQHRGSREDEVLIKGLANADKWQNVRDCLLKRLTEWFSRYWADPLEGEVLGQVPHDAHSDERRRKTEGRAKQWARDSQTLGLPFTIYEVPSAGQAWGCHRAAALLSRLPRTPYLSVFVAWAVTHVIHAMFRQRRQMDWVLRWNEEDPAEAEDAILQEVIRLQAGGAMAQKAAELLATALATPKAQSVIAAPGDAPSVKPQTIEWDFAKAAAWPRTQEAPLDATISLNGEKTDPDLELTDEQREGLRGFAVGITDEHLAATPGQHGDGGFEAASSILSRWAPDLRVSLERQRFRTAAASAAATHVTAHSVSEGLIRSLLISSDEDLSTWESLAAGQRDFGVWQDRIQVASFAGKSAKAQLQILRCRPAGYELYDWMGRYLRPMDDAAADTLASYLGSADTEELTYWLTYLKYIHFRGVPANWQPLANLIQHPNQEVRARAIEVAFHLEDQALADVFAASGWSWTDKLPKHESAYGSLLLSLAAQGEHEDFRNRVCPQALGELAERWPQRPDYLTAFAEFVAKDLDFLATSKSRTFPRSYLNRSGGWKLLADKMPEQLEAWLRPFQQDHWRKMDRQFMMREPFPLFEALDALEAIKPGSLGDLYAAVLNRSFGSGTRLGTLFQAPLELAGPSGETPRQLILKEANDDEKLFDFADGLQENNQREWLIEQIRRDLQARSAGRIARGMTLAGFLDDVHESQVLWETDLKSPPASGWLEEVYIVSRLVFLRNVWTGHWLKQFIENPSDDAAYCAHELLVARCDQRLHRHPSLPDFGVANKWSWRRRVHWRANADAIVAAFKKRNEDRKKHFLMSELPGPSQYPRML